MLSSDQVKEIRKDFPALRQHHPTNKRPPIYVDNSCVTLTPHQVVAAISDYHTKYPGCGGHRSTHWFAGLTEQRIHESRRELALLLGVEPAKNAAQLDTYPIIFTRNTSEALNLVAHSFGLMEGDTVLISNKEHNSNLCPWQEFQRRGGGLTIVDVDSDNVLAAATIGSALKQDLSIKLVALHHCSNLDGVTTPLAEIAKTIREIELEQRRHIFICIDGAQAAPHITLNLGNPRQADYLDVDFYAGSLHKMLGPSGIGFLYSKPEYLDCLRPFMVGGSTIVETSVFHRPVYADWPDRFEAGLQNYSGIHGAGAAAAYLRPIIKEVRSYEQHLNSVLTSAIERHHQAGSFRILGPLDPRQRGGVLTILVPEAPDARRIQGFEEKAIDWNIMYRTGQFCVDSWFSTHIEELPEQYTTLRFSMYFYNTIEEIELLAELISRNLA